LNDNISVIPRVTRATKSQSIEPWTIRCHGEVVFDSEAEPISATSGDLGY
jgi:hypothetical protein